MCRLFVGADPALWEPHTHSLRLHGASTSIRLEAFFWHVLEEIGRRDGLGLNELITKLYDELVEDGQKISNFASFLRVCCGRYLALELAGEIPRDRRVAIRSLDAEGVLARERQLWEGARPDWRQERGARPAPPQAWADTAQSH